MRSREANAGRIAETHLHRIDACEAHELWSTWSAFIYEHESLSNLRLRGDHPLRGNTQMTMGSGTVRSIVWFRHDLRVEDNPALHAAVIRGGAVLPVFIWAPEEEGAWPPGAASKWWLHQSLQQLQAALAVLGSPLTLRRGPSKDQLLALCQETGATAVLWNRRYEPAIIARDAAVENALTGRGIDVRSFNAALLHEPWTIQNKAGKPFQVFTPYWKTCLGMDEPAPCLPSPSRLICFPTPPKGLSLAALELEPRHGWTEGLSSAWEPGEAGAIKNLQRFLVRTVVNYDEGRNRPDRQGTSRLSPHLHFGEIGPRQIWHALRKAAGRNQDSWPRSQFVTELGWREFAHHLLYHFPHTPDQPLRQEFARFPWRANPHRLKAWQRGRTGFPLVDAGMRQLWATGWMHNRVRMVVASFLVKNLMISWQEGARWFWDTLVDADLANNTLGWQWTAGCGADAAPFFRIFNPVSQGQKYDPAGDYVKQWLPQLAHFPAEAVHKPRQASNTTRHQAGTESDDDYPEPIVSLFASRESALEAYAKVKRVKA